MKGTVVRTAPRSLPLWLALLLLGFGSWLQVAPAHAATVGWLIVAGRNLNTAQALPIISYPSSVISALGNFTFKLKFVISGRSSLLYAAMVHKVTVFPYSVKLGSSGQYDKMRFGGTVVYYSTSGSGSTAQTTVKFALGTTMTGASCTTTKTGATGKCVLPASHLTISSKSLSPVHGTSIGFAVQATDVLGQHVQGYTGTVHFTSTSSATLPADYTFTSTDAGFHVFKGVIFPSGGANTVIARDTETPFTSGKRTFNVT
jgi:hypothetical protein